MERQQPQTLLGGRRGECGYGNAGSRTLRSTAMEEADGHGGVDNLGIGRERAGQIRALLDRSHRHPAPDWRSRQPTNQR
jgi:hypothetical protein